MLGEEFGHLGLDRLGQQGARSVAQHLGKRVGERPWLKQLDDVSIRHGVSLLCWRSGGSNTPTIRRLLPVRPSPTFAHSSRLCASSASAHHLPDADQGATALARREISRFPGKERTHMLGSTTAPGHPGARDDAPVHVAFRSMHSVGVPGVLFSRLNTQPMRTPVNASPSPSLGPTHDPGTVWFARPSLEETRTLYSLPVSRRTHCHVNDAEQSEIG